MYILPLIYTKFSHDNATQLFATTLAALQHCFRKPIKGSKARTIMQINNNRNNTCACNHRIQILTTPTILRKYWRVTTIHDPSFNTKQIPNKSCLVNILPYFRITFRVICILIMWFYELWALPITISGWKNLMFNHDLHW